MPKQRYGNELHPLYSRWLSTTQRCLNPNHTSYKNYGARGIRLAADLKAFKDYAEYVGSLPNYDHINGSLDRIDNELGYQKGNLRWVDFSTQTANQRFSGKGKNRFTGINWSKTHSRWISRITLKGKSLMSKVCMTERQALEVRNAFIIEHNLPHTIQEWSIE